MYNVANYLFVNSKIAGFDAANIGLKHGPGNVKQCDFTRRKVLSYSLALPLAFVENYPRPANQAWGSVPKSLKLEK
jgi:hypothetical protein